MPSFDELQELANLVQPNKIKNLVLFGSSEESANKMDEFYRGLAQQKFKDDEEAAFVLYGKEPDNLAYQKLKERTYSRLLNTFILLEKVESYNSEKNRIFRLCHKNQFIVNMLLDRGLRKAAIPLAEKTVKLAQKYDITEIVLSLAKDLFTHYGTIGGNKKKFNAYGLLFEKYMRIHSAELKAERYYAELAANFVFSKSTKANLKHQAKSYSTELHKLSKDIQSTKFRFLTFIILTLRFEIDNDYKKLINVCEEALQVFTKKKIQKVGPNLIFTFSFKLAAGLLHQQHFKSAEENIIECKKLMPKGVTNWYISLDYHLMILYHSKQFQKIIEVFDAGYFHSDYKRQYEYILERWKLHEAIINYLILTDKVNPGKNHRKFRLNKFLNEVPEQSKDKRGSNITILILHILFLLQQEKYSAIIDRVESLKTYTQRYLRQDDTFRSNCFIKMLIQLPAANFHREAVVRKANPYWKKLLSVPLHKANQAAELEIIPYETLWEFVLDSLDNKFH